MSFFRRKPSLGPLVARPATVEDHPRIGRLAHTAERRFLTSSIADIADQLRRDPTALVESAGRLMGAATFGWRAPPVAWIRTLLLRDDVPATEAVRELHAPMLKALRRERTAIVAITLDEWSDPWLRTPLLGLGYRPMVEVVGYQKTRLDRPSSGNQVVAIRRATPDDLRAVLHLDAACFPLPWVKGAEIFAPAIAASPCFLVAEFGGEPVGYAFVSAHHGGRLFHLVRIATLPAYQGRGIGVRLLAEIVDYCRSHRAELLTLNTQADNYAAQRLYEWFGFVPTGDHQTVLGLDIPADSDADRPLMVR